MPAIARANPHSKVVFPHDGAFHKSLKFEVERYLESNHLRPRDLPRMYLKTTLIWVWWGASWALIALFADAWWQLLLGSIALGLAIAGIGMSVQHDANHGGYSNRPWVNRLLGLSLDAMGASSFIWRTKHNVVHHTFTNVGGLDDDLELEPLARLSPHQARRPWHRAQHLYMWLVYGFLHIKWVFYDDFRSLITRRVCRQPLPRLGALDHAQLWSGKVFAMAWWIVIPLLVRPAWSTLLAFLFASVVSGVVLGSTFQLAHCVEEADFVEPPADGRIGRDWAVHQVETTVDFAPQNALLTWYVGGLNFQVVHHLFPKVCHLHYPAIAKLLERVGARHGVTYRWHATLQSAIRSHYRLLRRLGRPAAVAG